MSVIARVRSNGARTKFPNFSVYRMSVVNNSVFGLKCLVYSNIKLRFTVMNECKVQVKI